MSQVMQAVRISLPLRGELDETREQRIHHRYFLAAIAVILTAGASWGAWLLWTIGFAGSFTGVSVHHVNAHGHAQIYGWVGLFIMGFGYRMFPVLWRTTLVAPQLAIVALSLMLFGIVMRTAGMTIPGDDTALLAAMAGGAAEILAVSLFAIQSVLTFRRSGMALAPWSAFVFGGLFFLLAQGVFDVWHTYMTMTATTSEALIWQVATYQAPLRDLQIHGLALFMVLGVSMRLLPGLFGMAEVPAKTGWRALALLLSAVVSESIIFIAYRWTANHALAALLLLPWLALAGGCGMIAWRWIRHRPESTDRSAKFVHTAYIWLAISLVMLLAMPIYQVISDIKFSHAYYGSIRHAITVGFVSMMIVGMSSKVVPMLRGISPDRLPRLWTPFILLNLGCFLRVSLQTLTDWHPLFFMLVGISGVLEVTALAIWGVSLMRTMSAARRAVRVIGRHHHENAMTA